MTGTATAPENFALIIGAMKSGTTSLFEILSQHPEVAVAREKEPGYFAEEEAMLKGWDWYVGLWDWNPVRHKIAIEASTAYSKAPKPAGVPERIAAVPGARFRFIYMMRHPLDQIRSHLRHAFYAGWERSLDRGVPDYMIEIASYAMQIDQYLKCFPQASMLLVTLEEFREAPLAVLRRVCAFLEVDGDFEFKGVYERYNAGDAYELPPFWAALVKARTVRLLADRLLPRSLWHGLRKRLPRLTSGRASLSRYDLTDTEKATILKRLGPDLRRLESTYGIDIARFWSIRVGAEHP